MANTLEKNGFVEKLFKRIKMGELQSVSKQKVDLFRNRYNFFIFQGIFKNFIWSK